MLAVHSSTNGAKVSLISIVVDLTPGVGLGRGGYILHVASEKLLPVGVVFLPELAHEAIVLHPVQSQ